MDGSLLLLVGGASCISPQIRRNLAFSRTGAKSSWVAQKGEELARAESVGERKSSQRGSY